jgi:hypothetical protein
MLEFILQSTIFSIAKFMYTNLPHIIYVQYNIADINIDIAPTIFNYHFNYLHHLSIHLADL